MKEIILAVCTICYKSLDLPNFAGFTAFEGAEGQGPNYGGSIVRDREHASSW